MKKMLFVVFFVLIGSISLFAQTSNPYVSVLIFFNANRDDSFRFYFTSSSTDNLSNLSLDRRLGSASWHIPLAHLANHMHSYGYSFVQMESRGSFKVVLFRRQN